MHLPESDSGFEALETRLRRLRPESPDIALRERVLAASPRRSIHPGWRAAAAVLLVSCVSFNLWVEQQSPISGRAPSGEDAGETTPPIMAEESPHDGVHHGLCTHWKRQSLRRFPSPIFRASRPGVSLSTSFETRS